VVKGDLVNGPEITEINYFYRHQDQCLKCQFANERD